MELKVWLIQNTCRIFPLHFGVTLKIEVVPCSNATALILIFLFKVCQWSSLLEESRNINTRHEDLATIITYRPCPFPLEAPSNFFENMRSSIFKTMFIVHFLSGFTSLVVSPTVTWSFCTCSFLVYEDPKYLLLLLIWAPLYDP